MATNADVSRFDVARASMASSAAVGMKPVFDGDKLFLLGSAVGRRLVSKPCDPTFDAERFAQQRVGLHHPCLRAARART